MEISAIYSKKWSCGTADHILIQSGDELTGECQALNQDFEKQRSLGWGIVEGHSAPRNGMCKGTEKIKSVACTKMANV